MGLALLQLKILLFPPISFGKLQLWFNPNNLAINTASLNPNNLFT